MTAPGTQRKYLLFRNGGRPITADWLERLVKCAESDPRIGAVVPAIRGAVEAGNASPGPPDPAKWIITESLPGSCWRMDGSPPPSVSGNDFGPRGNPVALFLSPVRLLQVTPAIARDGYRMVWGFWQHPL